MSNSNFKLSRLAVSAIILSGINQTDTRADEIFAIKEVHTMSRCYWLSKEIPSEGLCGEKMRPDVKVLIEEAHKGNSLAALRLGQLYGEGNWGVDLDLNEAVKWYKRSAQLGERNAQLRLGQAYEFGRMGITKDLKTAIKYYKMATEGGIYTDLENRIEELEKKSTGAK